MYDLHSIRTIISRYNLGFRYITGHDTVKTLDSAAKAVKILHNFHQ